MFYWSKTGNIRWFHAYFNAITAHYVKITGKYRVYIVCSLQEKPALHWESKESDFFLEWTDYTMTYRCIALANLTPSSPTTVTWAENWTISWSGEPIQGVYLMDDRHIHHRTLSNVTFVDNKKAICVGNLPDISAKWYICVKHASLVQMRLIS